MMYSILLLCCFLAIISAVPANVKFITLSSSQHLSLYSSSNLNTPISKVAVVGVLQNELLIDIDFRQSDNKLYGLGVNNLNGNGSLYILHPKTGAAKRVGPLSGCSLNPYPNPLEARYGFDFDPKHNVFRIVGEDTQNYVVDPASGTCTKKDNLYFNGPSGRGSTPSSAVAFTDNISGSNSKQWLLTGVHLAYSNVAYPASNGVYWVSESFFTNGPFDILTRKVGKKNVDIPIAITAPYSATTYTFDFNNLQLITFSLNSTFDWTPRAKHIIGTFPSSTFSDSVRCFGVAVAPTDLWL